MSSPDVDIDSLSGEQRQSLEQYLAFTNSDVESAIPILRRSQWNVQIAIAKFFDGDTATEETAESSSAPLRDHRVQETLINDYAYMRNEHSQAHVDPAPRVVLQPDSQISRKPPMLLAPIFAVVGLIFRILSVPASLFSTLFPFLPRLFSAILPGGTVLARGSASGTAGRRSLNVKDTTARFIREFEETYGSQALPFFEDGYAKAFDLAKRDLKYLLVVLISPEHDDTQIYVSETLLAPAVTDFIKDPQHRIILWAGDVRDSEAYQVSTALNCTKFPFAALICHTPSVSSTAMSVVARLTGPMEAVTFISRVQTAISQNDDALHAVRSTRAAQEGERNLRAEQNSAYEASLARDRERTRQRREQEASQAAAEAEVKAKLDAEQRKIENASAWRSYHASRLPSEPDTSAKDVTRISLRMPSGERVVRKFAVATTMFDLYTFVDCYNVEVSEKAVAPPADYEHTFKFQLASALPRRVFIADKSRTIGTEIGRSGNVLVEPIEEDEEEE